MAHPLFLTYILDPPSIYFLPTLVQRVHCTFSIALLAHWSVRRCRLPSAIPAPTISSFSTWFPKDPGMPQSHRMTMAPFYKSLLGS